MDTAGDALFRPVRTGNAFEETVERLLQAIRLGVVPPGERLPAERELAARLGVSRVTLREALHALQEAGFVESRRGRYGGTFISASLPVGGGPVPPPSVGSLEDALTLRTALEAGAAEAAAARVLSGYDRDHLRARLAECESAELTDYRRKDSRLHLAIAEVTGSASLTSAVADVRMRLNELLDGIPLLPRNIEHSNQQHAVIVAAVLDGDPAAARSAMTEHLDGTAALLRGFLS
ncbi:GntR family transcriptional regulator [Kutzneria viridogrisea]|uniref:GntR family transcription regulator n=2 Tax=Kutzneria TaxID=43356 RepID=W5W1R3_9PSEU|nr:GntR family transcriptional regulator [Kutzneria albida]AHH94792.1 GntR family transcription regulator [Kutzneria albida DSM 43870]MBA8930461.1 DNA-binding FadR family transcriptional regulator [Kutzneria viridogrisea]